MPRAFNTVDSLSKVIEIIKSRTFPTEDPRCAIDLKKYSGEEVKHYKDDAEQFPQTYRRGTSRTRDYKLSGVIVKAQNWRNEVKQESK